MQRNTMIRFVKMLAEELHIALADDTAKLVDINVIGEE
jgi:hypothetical protein